METELTNFNIFPKIVSENTAVTITLKPLVAFSGGQEFFLHLKPHEFFPQFGIFTTQTAQFTDSLIMAKSTARPSSAVVVSKGKQLSTVLPFRDGHAHVSKNGKWGTINKSGNLAIPAEYGSAFSFSEDAAVAKMNGKWCIIKII